MSIDSRVCLRCGAWLLAGVLAVTAGCSSSADKEAGSSGAVATTSGGTSSMGTNPSPAPLTFGSESKPADVAGEPDPTPPVGTPGTTGAEYAAPGSAPVTLPPDMPAPAPSKSEPSNLLPSDSATPPKSGEPVPVPPKKAG